MESTRRLDANKLCVAYLWKLVFFSKMEEVYTCQDLSNFHIVVWWSQIGPTDVARELATYKDRCPQSLRENVLTGVRRNPYTRNKQIKTLLNIFSKYQYFL